MIFLCLAAPPRTDAVSVRFRKGEMSQKEKKKEKERGR